MKRPLIRRAPQACAAGSRQRGVTMVLVALAMVAIIAMAALSIDVITLYLAKEEAQRCADMSALAAARVISISGITGDPSNSGSTGSSSWQAICGGSTSPASQAATAVAMQGVVGGTAANTVTVTYSAGGTSNADCSSLSSGGAFGVNPMVTVRIERTSLPNFFSRIWGNAGTSVSATATAEAFNPSFSATLGNQSSGTIIPVQPSCVKPWIVPNHDPRNPGPQNGLYCDQSGAGGPGPCHTFVSASDGSITHTGISLNGTATGGVIGEQFWLVPDCVYSGSTCSLRPPSPQANIAATAHIKAPQNLEYLPGQTLSSSFAVPSCPGGSGSNYEKAIDGCDQSAFYQCGVQWSASANPNLVDLSENPGGSGDTTNGVQCLINQANNSDVGASTGQDYLNTNGGAFGAPGVFPFQILEGSSNPLVTPGLASGSPITASTSIVALPIYDDSAGAINGTGTTPVTIVGFLQVFINAVDQFGNVNVTVLNVAGCSNGAGTYPVSSNAVTGTSPVPVRLITPP